jgi:cysteine desulfurase/selenocysteine lyase
MSSLVFDPEFIRKDFPILAQKVHGKPLVYFDNAATTQKPRKVIDVVRTFYETCNANVHRGVHELSARATDAYEKARAKVAQFINARQPEEIIFTRGATEAINLVAYAWGLANLKPGDVVLLTEMEHHSNIVPWQIVAKRTGAKLAYVPVVVPEGQLDMQKLWELLDANVRFLGVVHVSNSLGTINPVAEICEKARKKGIVTLVDGAQSAGHMPVDVQEIGCDFFVFSGHKLCGPTGIGVLYGRMELLEKMPPFQAGGEMILTVDLYHTEYKIPPYRFEAGTPHVSGAVGLHAALEYLETIGRENIAAHDRALAEYALEKLSTVRGIKIFGPKLGRAGIVSFTMEGIHPHDVVALADHAGIALRGGHHCTQPLMRKLGVEGTARASFYFYNTFTEVEYLAHTLQEIRRFFG